MHLLFIWRGTWPGLGQSSQRGSQGTIGVMMTERTNWFFAFLAKHALERCILFFGALVKIFRSANDLYAFMTFTDNQTSQSWTNQRGTPMLLVDSEKWTPIISMLLVKVQWEKYLHLWSVQNCKFTIDLSSFSLFSLPNVVVLSFLWKNGRNSETVCEQICRGKLRIRFFFFCTLYHLGIHICHFIKQGCFSILG